MHALHSDADGSCRYAGVQELLVFAGTDKDDFGPGGSGAGEVFGLQLGGRGKGNGLNATAAVKQYGLAVELPVDLQFARAVVSNVAGMRRLVFLNEHNRLFEWFVRLFEK